MASPQVQRMEALLFVVQQSPLDPSFVSESSKYHQSVGWWSQCEGRHLLSDRVNFPPCVLTVLQMTQFSRLPVNTEGQPDSALSRARPSIKGMAVRTGRANTHCHLLFMDDFRRTGRISTRAAHRRDCSDTRQ
ncbi:unnamed protein product [Pleuronectes platessa]|uniref:Uncharacterized protein n=1 Tax=Pleuronectes platessa TaxID=8262 RepID=A0A9N7UHL5_PLEPL|nr:unnamed protein product [Pleuronectes platessa]